MRQLVRVFLPTNSLRISIYPASDSLSSWTLMFPEVAPVCSLSQEKSASSTESSSVIIDSRSWEWIMGFSSFSMTWNSYG